MPLTGEAKLLIFPRPKTEIRRAGGRNYRDPSKIVRLREVLCSKLHNHPNLTVWEKGDSPPYDKGTVPLYR
jgi:hypothetical protein